MTATAILIPVRPCIKCGACDRYKSGDCRPCQKIRHSVWLLANPEKVKTTNAAWKAKNLDQNRLKRIVYRAENAERIKVNRAEWRLNNLDKVKAISSSWKSKNRERVKEKRLAYYAANQERMKELAASYYAVNRDKEAYRVASRKRALAYKAANPEKVKAVKTAYRKANPNKMFEWHAANPGAARIHNQNRRARKKANGGVLSKDLSAKLFKLQKGKCACCALPLGVNFHLDHIYPLIFGGKNNDDNIQLLRSKCNLQKSAKHPIDYMQSKGYLL